MHHVLCSYHLFENNDQGVISAGSDSMSDLLARQNYWDSSLGYWPTHTVSEYNNKIQKKILSKESVKGLDI